MKTRKTQYAAWRAKAERQMAVLAGKRAQALSSLRDIARDISTLTEVMANGASGGTMWKHSARCWRQRTGTDK